VLHCFGHNIESIQLHLDIMSIAQLCKRIGAGLTVDVSVVHSVVGDISHDSDPAPGTGRAAPRYGSGPNFDTSTVGSIAH
jgi:hypothetical protein